MMNAAGRGIREGRSAAGEASWIPEPVRYTVSPEYKEPFGTTNDGRATDTSANGRTYLIYEKHGDACTVLLLR